jgi:bisphosphoglycerate-independent phosphoglycerate mutase (AlkP superfamily)
MVDPESGGPFTAHTTLPVVLIVCGAASDLKEDAWPTGADHVA